jgi:cyanophycinase
MALVLHHCKDNKGLNISEQSGSMSKRNAPENGCPTPKGTLIIIGGKENKGEQPDKNISSKDAPLEVLEAMVTLTRKKSPRLEILTSAGSEGKEQFKEYRKIFSELGVEEINHIHHYSRSEVLNDSLTERIKLADGLFITGGDQLKLTGLYGGTELLTQLKIKFIEEPFVLGGTSAGAMALSTPMIYAGSKEVEQIAGAIKVTTGLEFLKDVCIDTHFVHRGRFIRMAQVIVTNPTCIGLGIEEDTALVIKNGTEAAVIGSGTVVVIEGFDIDSSNIQEFSEKKVISIRNLKVHLLSKDDTYLIPRVNPPHA